MCGDADKFQLFTYLKTTTPTIEQCNQVKPCHLKFKERIAVIKSQDFHLAYNAQI